MLHPSKSSSRLRRTLTAASLAAVACLFAATPAGAHFILKKPASWNSQDQLGNPQKLGPCGNDGGTPTGIVTAFKPGETIDIEIDETIFHPGHYRVALSVMDRSELPEPPPVTPADTDCGSAPIMNPAVFPVLADGMLEHNASFKDPQTIQVTLPSNVTCEKCTLQVIQFMSKHGLNDPGGCFYSHCADISINANAAGAGGSSAGGSSAGGSNAGGSSSGGSPSGGSNTGGSEAGSGGASAGTGGVDEPDSGGGCGCSVPAGDASPFAALAGFLGLGMLLRRRRR